MVFWGVSPNRFMSGLGRREGEVRRYAKDRKVAALSQGTELHLVIMQVRIYELVRLEEV